MKALRIHQVDAFTDVLFGGNPTAVVCDADVLDDNEMRKIAREMNLSESVFLLPSDQADVKLRFFTPPVTRSSSAAMQRSAPCTRLRPSSCMGPVPVAEGNS